MNKNDLCNFKCCDKEFLKKHSFFWGKQEGRLVDEKGQIVHSLNQSSQKTIKNPRFWRILSLEFPSDGLETEN